MTTKPFTALRKRGSWTFLALQAAYRLYMGLHVFGLNLSTKIAPKNSRAVVYESYHRLQHFATSSSLTSCELQGFWLFFKLSEKRDTSTRNNKNALVTKQGRQAGAIATCCILPLPASRLCSETPRTWLGSDPVGSQLATKLRQAFSGKRKSQNGPNHKHYLDLFGMWPRVALSFPASNSHHSKFQ